MAKPSRSEAKLIRDELKRRQALRAAILAIVDSGFMISDGKYVRRGQVQRMVCEKLGLRINNAITREITAVLKDEGCEPTTVHGKYYWKNLASKQYALETADFKECADERLLA